MAQPPAGVSLLLLYAAALQLTLIFSERSNAQLRAACSAVANAMHLPGVSRCSACCSKDKCFRHFGCNQSNALYYAGRSWGRRANGVDTVETEIESASAVTTVTMKNLAGAAARTPRAVIAVMLEMSFGCKEQNEYELLD